MRLLRTITGILALVVGLPLLLGGAALMTVANHRSASGAFTARMQPIGAAGYAVVIPDLDALLGAQAAFARAERTSLRIEATTANGPAFVGMTSTTQAARYLAKTHYTRVTDVRLARGDLPVQLDEHAGFTAALPSDQRFWVHSGNGSLQWTPADLRGQRIALVVMNPDGAPLEDVTITAHLWPGWLDPTSWALTVLGATLLILSFVLLCWPVRPREIVYVVDPAQVPDIAERLGVPLPSTEAMRALADNATPDEASPSPSPTESVVAQRTGSSAPAAIDAESESEAIAEEGATSADSATSAKGATSADSAAPAKSAAPATAATGSPATVAAGTPATAAAGTPAAVPAGHEAEPIRSPARIVE